MAFLAGFVGVKSIKKKINKIDQDLQSFRNSMPKSQEQNPLPLDKIYDSLTEKTLKLRIWQNDVNIDLSYDKQNCDLSTFTSEFPVNIEILNPSFEIANLEILLNNKPIGNALHLQPFNHEDVLTLNIYDKASRARRTYFINVLNSQFPHFAAAQSKESNLSRQGVLYDDILSYKDEDSNRPRFIYKMDLSGKLLYYKAHQDEMIDFKKTLAGGQAYYSYLVRNPHGAGLRDKAYFASNFVVMNQNYQVIDSPNFQMPGYSRSGES